MKKISYLLFILVVVAGIFYIIKLSFNTSDDIAKSVGVTNLESATVDKLVANNLFSGGAIVESRQNQSTNQPSENKLTISSEVAYILNANSTTISKCIINKDTGLFESGCTSTGSGFNAPYGIDFNSDHSLVYIANKGSNSISLCTVNQETGDFLNCSFTISGLDVPSGIAITKKFAYITNEKDSTVSKCSINNQSGAISSNCSYVGSDFSNPEDIEVSKDGVFVFVANGGTSTISVCVVDGLNGDLNHCTQNDNGFNDPQSTTMLLNTPFIYVTNNNANTVSVCTLTNGGLLSNCEYTGQGFNGLTDFTFNTNDTRAYITMSALVAVCDVNKTDGTLNNCQATGGGFNMPSGIRILKL